jgi:hypothetical protein
LKSERRKRMQIYRIKEEDVLRLTAKGYQDLYGESISKWFNWVNECADPDEVRKATLKAWGLLKRNSDLTGEQSDWEEWKYEL